MGAFIPFRQELQVKHFGFSGFCHNDFHTSLWSKNRRYFIVYRFLVFLYWTTFFAVDFATSPQKDQFCLYLSHWNEAQLAVFFAFAFYASVQPVHSRQVTPLRSQVDDNDEAEVDTCSTLPADETKQNEAEPTTISWHLQLTTMMFVTSLSISLAVTVLFVLVELPGMNDKDAMTVGNIHLHFVNSFLIIIDFLINRIHIRFFHFIYVSIFTVTYCTFLYILHVSGINSAIYGIVNWEKWPLALGFSLFMIFLIAPVTHMLMYCLQRGWRWVHASLKAASHK